MDATMLMGSILATPKQLGEGAAKGLVVPSVQLLLV
jgi:hypothetical protein